MRPGDWFVGICVVLSGIAAWLVVTENDINKCDIYVFLTVFPVAQQ